MTSRARLRERIAPFLDAGEVIDSLFVASTANSMHMLPRRTIVGSPRGIWWCCRSLGEELCVNSRYFADGRSADALARARP